jgi:hypothetical protein
MLIPNKDNPAITIKATPINNIRFFAAPLKTISNMPITNNASGENVNNCDTQLLAVVVTVVVAE